MTSMFLAGYLRISMYDTQCCMIMCTSLHVLLDYLLTRGFCKPKYHTSTVRAAALFRHLLLLMRACKVSRSKHMHAPLHVSSVQT